jgi:YHS domain-containing protein
VTKLHIIFVAALSMTACNRETSAPSESAPATVALPDGMRRVSDPSQVCMVNDQFMGKPQIPVEVEGRTYYGCCAMCKDKLVKQPESRTAQDPVTGEPVDKAKAIIVQDSDGRVKYFTSEDTLRRFRG